MDIERIREIAEKCNLEENMDKFIEWFNTRFPDESNEIESYCAEWVGRFNSGHPWAYMDSKSMRFYCEIFDVMKCVLCDNIIKGLGNNPEPLSDSGRCCDYCNSTKVIPERLKPLKMGVK